MLVVLQIVFIFLKLTVLPAISWWLVLLPLLVIIGFWTLSAITVGIYALFAFWLLD